MNEIKENLGLLLLICREREGKRLKQEMRKGDYLQMQKVSEMSTSVLLQLQVN